MEIPELELDEWLTVLKPYQRELITNLVDQYGVEEAINRWIIANGPANTVKFGGVANGQDVSFLDRFKDEINKFICGHPSYDKEREEYLNLNGGTKAALVSALSSFLGDKLGASVTFIAPIVVLTLYLVAKMGKNAYCKGIDY